MLKRFTMFAIGVLGILLMTAACGDDEHADTRRVGWAIGSRSDNTAAVLHTDDGGLTWEEQGNSELWSGMTGNDISAVDDLTAWAAVGTNENEGAILHTGNGGADWEVQALPEGVNDIVKGVKGLSPSVAWAVTLEGTVMRTMDGGESWVVVPHDGVTMKQINRIDAKGEDLWIADWGGGEYGMIHSPDFGETWRREQLPGVDPSIGGGPMGVNMVDSQIAWAAVRPEANLYRTKDGGAVWELAAPDVSGPNDIDDICAPDADTVWAVQNIGGLSGGRIIRVRLVDGEVVSDVMDPTGNYQYEGVTCLDERTVWAVGFKAYGVSPDLPDGVILHTDDGGENWTSLPMPVKDVSLWKVSFVGAHR